MQRSFTDRVLGGVCGGLAARTRLNPWLARFLFVVLTFASGGAFAVLYIFLWWVTPQESLVTRRRGRGVPVPLLVLLVVGTALAWAGRDLGYLRAASGQDLFWPGAFVLLGVVFFLRQLRG